MRQLQRSATARHDEERRIAGEAAAAREAADEEHARLRSAVEADHQSLRADADGEFTSRRQELMQRYEADRAAAQGEYRQVRTGAQTHAAKTAAEADRERKEAAWQILTLFDANKHTPRQQLEATRAELTARAKAIGAIGADVVAIAAGRGVSATAPKGEARNATPDSTKLTTTETAANLAAVDEGLDRYRSAAQALVSDPVAWWALGPAPLLAAVVGAAAGWIAAHAIGAVLVGLAAAAVTAAVLIPRARTRTRNALSEIDSARLEAELRLNAADRAAVEVARQETAALRERRDRELAELGFRLEQLVGQAAAQSSDQLEEAGKLFPAMLAEMRTAHEQAVARLEAEHHARIAMLTQRRETSLAQIEAEHVAAVEALESRREEAWQQLVERWFIEYDDVRAALRDMRAEAQRLFPNFGVTDFDAWPKPLVATPSIALGSTEIDLAKIKHGLAADAQLTPPETRLAAPVLMTLAEHPTLLITAEGEGRARGVELLRLMMLRFLTAMPPGKVRFTILDPVGLGDNFQSFMHLADADEQLIAGRIWSESRDIEEQLTRLTSHLETVLQKYLRSEYETIHEYNAMAGEVAEPFQVLVIAGFPTNFTESAARRLVSLVTGGPRCGVFTLLGVDAGRRLPADFHLDDLKTQAAWLDWEASRSAFVWRYPAFEQLPLVLDEEPAAERMIDTLKKAGAAAKAAVKVEVPFSVVAPPDGCYWDKTCADELLVPVGRAGANRLQNVRLGKGTSQHLLVAGKTGSGKSTFLHALVTSAALHYGPDEVEFYLIDFKKGVEFKSYATHRLPHARVIAIESEREFGLSVLERLDEELKRRGERFRAAGVQNLADFRAANPTNPTPRLLLIIDEFQELFVEDDKLASESSLLLDRLVRQGRAFGMHVLLGTQTLSGAYTLARSTLGQIAVRVALESSEADAHLILSDERNTAARFLSRPGEAIYNAQNGLITANEPFQVVWLPDRERSVWLDALDERRHRLELPLPEQVVFEGNAPADPQTNRQLAAALDDLPEEDRQPARCPGRAWLGAAVAIKPATHVDFTRRAGTNLLVVGSDEPDALGTLAAAVVSLHASDPAALVTIIDTARPGEAGHGVWQKVVAAGGENAQRQEEAELAATLAELVEEMKRREAEPSVAAVPHYVVLYNAGRLRELRRSDDDYGFGGYGSSSETPPTPDKLLGDLLRNGPAVGLHTLVWCDSYKAVTRLFDRQTLREFALRVALQLSAADSSNLIDTPAASDLRLHRALLYNDETGQTEKFRPYGPPSERWLERVQASRRLST
ncbi:FtsK-like domain-containing protein [Botrimarina hoheduenensis]|uniref:FtsK-like domain-containing protein n=2 Tax=Botrimarina hoheduenensis TaxID=2528000 RepID=A0A5C5VZ16_9BACT|nr:FtsK-like domain-containing protein [Botrimarina hoheduenensis]